MPTTITIRDRSDDAKTSLVRRALEAIRSYTVAPMSLKDPALARLFGAGYETAAGIPVTDQNVFTFSAVYDAVNQSSSDLAKLPLNLRIRMKEGGSRPFDTSKTYRLLKYEANPDMSAFEFKRTLQAHALTCKGAFAEIERDGTDRPAALWPLTPNRVDPFLERETLENGRYRSKLRYRIDGDNQHIIEAKDMIHIRGLGYDGYCAYPVIDQARQAIGIALAAERYAGAFFGNNSNLGGLLTSENPDLDEGQAKELQERIEKLHKGPDRAWRLLVLGAGFKYARTGVTPSESQLDQVRDGQVVEVARFFNMPVHKLKNLTRSTNNNIEQQDLEYYKGHQLNWISNWEAEFNRKLIPSLEIGQQFFKHNAAAALRGDVVGRTALYSALLDRGVLNADDVLELEDMNPQPESQGKIYLVQGAMVPKDKIQALADATIEKAKRKPAAPAAPAPDPAADPNAQRAAAAEALAEEARQAVQQEREARIAAEAAGVVTAAELARLRTAEQVSIARAAQFELVAEELRRDQQIAIEGRQRLEAELLEAQQARDAAAISATEALATADRAAAAQVEAEQRAAIAAAATADAQTAAAAAEVRALEAGSLAQAAGSDRAAAAAAMDAAVAQALEARATADRLEADGATIAAEAETLRGAAEQARADAERRDVEAQVEIAAARARILDIETALEAATLARAADATTAAEATEQAAAERAALAADLAAARTALAAERERADVALAAQATAEAARLAAATAQEESRTALEAAEAARITAVAEIEAARTAAARANEATESARAEAVRAAQSVTDTERTSSAAHEEARAALATAETARLVVLAEVEEVRATAVLEQQRAAEAAVALAAVRQQLATLETALESTRGSHDAAATAFQATVTTLERQAAQDRHRAAAEEARAAELSERVAQRDAEIRTVQQADTEAMAGVIAAHRGLVVDIMRRMVERETDRARRAQVTPEKLRAWLATFYDGHADLMRNALLPAIRVHLAFIRSADDPIEATRRLVDAHVAESVRQIRTVIDEDADAIAASFPALLYRWDTERPTAIADGLMQKELNYARKI